MKIESTILSRIAERVRVEVDRHMAETSLADMQARLKDAPPVRSFHAALQSDFALITEIKQRSPSMGEMRAEMLPTPHKPMPSAIWSKPSPC